MQYLPPGKELEPHAQARSLVSIEWMRMFLFPEFWEHHIGRFGSEAILQNAPLAERYALGDKDALNIGLELNFTNPMILDNELITPDMTLRDIMAFKIVNIRRNMQRESRDRLRLAMVKYPDGVDDGIFDPALPPLLVHLPPLAPTAPQEPGAPQPPVTGQNQEGPQIQGQPQSPAPGAPQDQGPGQNQAGPPVQPSPVLPPSPLDNPTPTVPYTLPPTTPEPLKASQVVAANKIAAYLKYFRNILGLHVIATFAQSAMWFHLAKLVSARGGEDISAEDWEYFLRACNLSGEMLRCFFSYFYPSLLPSFPFTQHRDLSSYKLILLRLG